MIDKSKTELPLLNEEIEKLDLTLQGADRKTM
jgi:hypothetical protein